MIGKYKVVTLCGSTKFKKEFIDTLRRLTLEGYIVLLPGVYAHSGDNLTSEDKLMLDDMHKRKIDMSDEIYVINKNDYIGDSTNSEIEYAKAQGKPVTYMYPHNHTEYINAKIEIDDNQCISITEVDQCAI